MISEAVRSHFSGPMRSLADIERRAQERERQERRQQPMSKTDSTHSEEWHAKAAELRAKELDELCTLLRRHGVRWARVNGYELHFGDAVPEATEPRAPVEPKPTLPEPKLEDGLTKAEQNELYAST